MNTDIQFGGSWRFSEKSKADKKAKKKSGGDKLSFNRESMSNIIEDVVDDQIDEDQKEDAKKTEEEEDKGTSHVKPEVIEPSIPLEDK